MMARTAEGRAFRILTIIDEYTRECLTILTQRRITSQDIIEQLFYLFVFGVLLNMFGLITVLNSLQRRYADG